MAEQGGDNGTDELHGMRRPSVYSRALVPDMWSADFRTLGPEDNSGGRAEEVLDG